MLLALLVFLCAAPNAAAEITDLQVAGNHIYVFVYNNGTNATSIRVAVDVTSPSGESVRLSGNTNVAANSTGSVEIQYEFERSATYNITAMDGVKSRSTGLSYDSIMNITYPTPRPTPAATGTPAPTPTAEAGGANATPPQLNTTTAITSPTPSLARSMLTSIGKYSVAVGKFIMGSMNLTRWAVLVGSIAVLIIVLRIRRTKFQRTTFLK